MAWEALLQVLLAKFFNILTWPSLTLLCPLYASFWAMENDSHAKRKQCLSFWVLFAPFAILEQAFAEVLLWLPFWPYVKGVMTVLLVIPYFGGASYVYKCFGRIYPFKSSILFFLLWNILFIPIRKCLSLIGLLLRRICFSLSGQHNFIDEMDKNKTLDGQNELENIIFQGTSKPSYDNIEREQRPIISKKVQEWSCAICLISTPDENCLKKHLQGNQHKAKKEEMQAEESALKSTYNTSYMAKRNNGMVLLGNLVNFETWSGLISPVARSIRWCRWEKPDIGWIKLNTDGSIDRENAGFGGLLRDHKGDAICAFVSKAPLDDVFLVELWAIWRGLVLALGLGIQVVWVESDSKSVVKTINREQSYNGKAHSCLKHIWKLLSKFKKYKLSHSWRETNRAADYLSRMVLERSDVVLWPADFPNNLHDIIKNDAQGRIYRRR